MLVVSQNKHRYPLRLRLRLLLPVLLPVLLGLLLTGDSVHPRRVSTSDVIANQLEYVAKDAVHQFGGYRGKLLLVLLLAAAIDQSQFNDLHVASAMH